MDVWASDIMNEYFEAVKNIEKYHRGYEDGFNLKNRLKMLNSTEQLIIKQNECFSNIHTSNKDLYIGVLDINLYLDNYVPFDSRALYYIIPGSSPYDIGFCHGLQEASSMENLKIHLELPNLLRLCYREDFKIIDNLMKKENEKKEENEENKEKEENEDIDDDDDDEFFIYNSDDELSNYEEEEEDNEFFIYNGNG